MRARALLDVLGRSRAAPDQKHEAVGERKEALVVPHDRRPQPEFASLADVQAGLSEHEAVLSFQVGLWQTYQGYDGGGSWLIAVTKHRTTVHRLPDRTRLASVIPVFVGLLTANEGRSVAAAVRLYQELLADAVASLPPHITRLVIVADGRSTIFRSKPCAPPRWQPPRAPGTRWRVCRRRHCGCTGARALDQRTVDDC